MMPFNEQILERFKRMNKAGRLGHAYLFTGSVGTGKRATAMALAQLVNCTDTNCAPCGACVPCQKITALNHPYIFDIGHDDTDSIKIDTIRHVLGRVGLKAYEAISKVFIIEQAHRMTNDAANALLKTLEEPPPHTLFVLTSSVPEACLDTIKSRCHNVKFFDTGDESIDEKDHILDVFLRSVVSDEYLKSLSADKEKAARAMKVLLNFIRDAAFIKNGVPIKYCSYRNRMGDLKTVAERSMEDLNALSAQIVRAKSLADENLNVRMALNLVRERLCTN